MITTTQAAKRLGLGVKTLARYIEMGKVPAPQVIQFGQFRVHSWTEEEIERVRKLLPKIKNGRKTRYEKQKKQKQTKKKEDKNQTGTARC